MRYYYPDYFDKFQCVPGKECTDSCCIRWQINVDPDTLKKYKRVTGELGQRMAEKIDFKTGCIAAHGEENRCEFLNEDNLCDIVLELGEEYLSETCHTHPRHEEVYLNVRERSLAMTCPVACEQLLRRKEPVKILYRDVKEKEEHDRFFDQILFESLLKTRDALLKISQNRLYPVAQRMIMVLGMAHDVEKRIRSRASRKRRRIWSRIFPSFPGFALDELETLERIWSVSRTDTGVEETIIRLENAEEIMQQVSDATGQKLMTDMIFVLSTMEPLKPTWIPFLQSILNIRGQLEPKEYCDLQKEYHCQEEETQLEQLLAYFIYVYCCTSVYDEMLLAKIKMAVVNTLLIREFWFMRWLENDKKLTVEDQAELAHWYVREIENSDENMEQWDSLMQRNPRFSLKILLILLKEWRELS